VHKPIYFPLELKLAPSVLSHSNVAAPAQRRFACPNHRPNLPFLCALSSLLPIVRAGLMFLCQHCRYTLFSAVSHVGETAIGGHYTACIRLASGEYAAPLYLACSVNRRTLQPHCRVHLRQWCPCPYHISVHSFRWVHVDDANVQFVREKEVLKAEDTAYLLFYVQDGAWTPTRPNGTPGK
jgi:ubiquitin carboxyl-terminal hydrolase